MLKIIKKIIHVFIDILMLFTTLLILFLLYRIISIKYFNKETILGYSFYEIATGSMEPTLNINDFIIVKEKDNYNVKDIVTYKEGNDYITHRIIEINDNTLITKGDANNSTDKKISKDAVIGKVVKVIPKGGIIKRVILTPKVIISVLVSIVLINVCLSINKKEDEDEKIEIITFD